MEDYITVEGVQVNIIKESDFALSGETSAAHVKNSDF